ncbi:MAG: glycosyltransferase [Candidatus Korarchaeota archaeon]|nr:glycosyltransferase [Thermoproteota archaeon]
MDQPVVSIILTTFNSEDTVFDVLSAIARQDMSLKSIELIVVDGGSKDRTLEIVNEFLRKYGAFFYGVKVIVHDKNYGLSRARNDGIKTSSGIYILILDDDIIMNSSTLRILLEFLKKSPRNIAAVMPLCVKYPEGTLDRWYRIINEGRISYASSVTNCVLIRREVFEEIGFYDETLGLPFTMGEEIEFAARAKSKGYHVLTVGFEKVLHIMDKKMWKEKKIIQQVSSKSQVKMINVVRVSKKIVTALRSLGSPSYRYAYKRYLASLPPLDKLKWYMYLAAFLSTVLSVTIYCISSLLGILHQLAVTVSISLAMNLTLYISTLMEYWNPKVLRASLAYSAVALVWRMLRSIMLLTPVSVRKPAN